MSNFRFGLMVVVAFALTFIGVWLSMKNSAVTATRLRATPPAAVATETKPRPAETLAEPPAPAGTVETPSARVVAPALQPAPAKSFRGDGDRGRDRLRLTAIAAAEAFVRSPCDRAAKVAFVVAAATYIHAAAAKADNGAPPEVFRTPLDDRVREAISKAFAAGGVGIDDFPVALHPLMTGYPAATPSSCPPGRTAQTLEP